MHAHKLIVALFIIVFSGCRSNSYYGAISYNDDKFTGTKKEMASYLVDVQNRSQFVKNASVIAGKNSKLRTTYLAATEVESLMGSLIFDLNLFATKSGVMLPRALDGDADRDYQFINKQAVSDKFDLYYINESLRYLTALEESVKAYSIDGQEEQARAFSSKHLTEINNSIARLQTARDAVSADTSSVSK